MEFSNPAKLLVYLVVLMVIAVPVSAQDGTVTIKNIRLQGLQVWAPSNVNSVLEEQGLSEGQTYERQELQRLVNSTIEELQTLGLFSDIQVSRKQSTLVFQFEEFNRIKTITFQGNKIYDKSKLNDVLLLQTGDPANPFRLEQARQDLLNFYHQQGYSGASVRLRRETRARGQVAVTFEIDEGDQRTVNDISFYYSPKLSFLGESYRNLNLKLILPIQPGKPYSKQMKRRSTKIIKQWYSTMGYLDASVDVKIWRNLTENGIDVEFHITQGSKYHLGQVTITGNELYSDTEIRQDIPLESGDVFNVRAFQNGVQAVERRYLDRGYANVAVDYTIKRLTDTQPRKVNVTFQVDENKPVYVQRIEIVGNHRTYDRVIRREIRLKPGGLLDGQKKRNSLQRLRNLGYFRKVEMSVEPGSQPNWKIVRVRVKEGRTGQFQFGGGFSSSTGFTGNLSIRKDNFSLWDYSHGFTGRGQSIQASAQIGNRRSNFNISWNDPWFNDDLDDTSGPQPKIPIGFGWSAFNTARFREEGFDEIRTGGSLSLSREFGPARANQVDAEYSFSQTRIENLDDANVSGNDVASVDFLNEAGNDSSFERSIGSLRVGIQRDLRNNRLFPSEGYFVRLDNRIAGEFLAGDANFINPELDVRSYIPSFGSTFFAFRFNYKTISGYGSDSAGVVPSFEKFFLGGNQNVRGYDFRDIAVYKQNCPGRTNFSGFQKCTGGKTSMFANLEYRFKLMRRSMQLYAFTDFGNVFEESFEFGTNFKQSAGIGFRVRSPMGPINISWSRRLEPTAPDTSDEGETQIDFNIGTGF